MCIEELHVFNFINFTLYLLHASSPVMIACNAFGPNSIFSFTYYKKCVFIFNSSYLLDGKKLKCTG